MRRVAAAFVLLLPLLTAGAQESVVSVDLYMGLAKPDDVKYLAGIQGAPRALRVRIKQPGTNASKTQRVTVTGLLTKEQVATLLQSMLGTDKSYWSLKRPLGVTVAGDEHRAEVSTSYFCGLLCGSGISYLYTYDQARWRYLYSFDRWIS
jgi:hypothetical protein